MSAWLANLLVLAALGGAGQLEPQGEVVAGEPVILQLLNATPTQGVQIVAKYRENAHARLRHQQTVGTTDIQGELRWVPEEAGVVVLSWPGGSKQVSVRHKGVPVSGVIVALLAGLLLLGGSLFFFVRMLRDGGG